MSELYYNDVMDILRELDFVSFIGATLMSVPREQNYVRIIRHILKIDIEMEETSFNVGIRTKDEHSGFINIIIIFS